MSSHKEAPGSPTMQRRTTPTSTRSSARTSPSTVTLIANFVPLEDPAGGPNFFEFGDDVLYEIHVDNNGDGASRHHLPIPLHTPRCATRTLSSTTPGRSTSLTSTNWNRRQFASVIEDRRRRRAGIAGHRSGLPAVQHRTGRPRRTTSRSWPTRRSTPSPPARRCSPGNGPRASTSTSARSSTSASCARSSNAHLAKMPAAPGVDSHQGQEHPHHRDPGAKTSDLLVAGADGTSVDDPKNTIGVYATASRQRSKMFNARRHADQHGRLCRRSRGWRAAGERGAHPDRHQGPVQRHRPGRRQAVPQPFRPPGTGRAAAGALSRACSRSSAKYTKATQADIEAIFLTGCPAGVVAGLPERRGTARPWPICSGSTSRSRRRRASPATSGSWAATWPASRTGGGYSTTSPRSNCAPSPVPRSRSSTRPSSRTPPPERSHPA